MNGEQATDRIVFTISGVDRVKFLQGLITNDVDRLSGGLIYAAMLTPQGKYLADFFLISAGDNILLDVQETLAQGLLQRLNMYKLRADVAIEPSDLNVLRGTGPTPKGAWADPRHPALGWRTYSTDTGAAPTTDWDAIRVAHCIPQSGIELIPNETYILEAGFEHLSGVDFKKGCYVGQEITARMKHKTELRKGLAIVDVAGVAPVGTAILADGKPVGTLFTQSGGKGIAFLRFDRAGTDMMAGGISVSWKKVGNAKGS
ncbi:MAG: folate-binding protein [Marinosulfonomonas sp.]|nr:folate-binding protein [Marinosulfonomonas sp.]